MHNQTSLQKHGVTGISRSAPRPEAPRPEAPRPEAPKLEAPRPEAPRLDWDGNMQKVVDVESKWSVFNGMFL